MREKLIELIYNYDFDDTDCNLCNRTDEECQKCGSECLADYLLENGVVVLPCKVGDDVWTLSLDKYCIMGEKTGWTHKIEQRKFKYRLLDLYEFGETLFLTREEAEKALERSKQ